MESKDKFPPIKIKTARQLKWAWSTIFLINFILIDNFYLSCYYKLILCH